MIVTVRIFGYLRKYCNPEASKGFEITLPDCGTAQDLLDALGIPENEEKIVLVNDAYTHDKKISLNDKDAVSIYPYVGGG